MISTNKSGTVLEIKTNPRRDATGECQHVHHLNMLIFAGYHQTQSTAEGLRGEAMNTSKTR